MKTCDVVIIGAGISGLSLAHYCYRAGLDTVVLEKAGRAGGCLHSHQFTGDADGFWLELGAHTCYSSYGELIAVIEEAGLRNRLVPRARHPFRLLVEGRLRSIPSMLDIPGLVFSLPRILTAKKAGETMESYYSRILGKNNFAKVFGPVFDAIISQDARDFPADSLFKKRSKRKDVLKDFTLDQGLQTITDTLAAGQWVTLLTGQDVKPVEYRGGRFITATDGEVFESRFLAVAAPPAAASKLLKVSFPELSDHLARLRSGSVETVGVALPKDAVKIPRVAGIIGVGDRFFSAVTRDVVEHETRRGFAFHFRPGLLNRTEKVRRIAEVLGVEYGMITDIVQKDDNAVPSLTLGHGLWVREADRLVAGTPLMLTGNYYSGVSIEDCVERSVSEFVRIQGGGGPA